jgi:transcriptional regulator with XRE-family HTH domain
MRVRRPHDIAAAAREARRKRGLSQRGLAGRLEVNREWVSRFENGEPGVALGLVLRTLNELGLALTIGACDTEAGKTKGQKESSNKTKGRRAPPPISIDEIVDDRAARSDR